MIRRDIPERVRVFSKISDTKIPRTKNARVYNEDGDISGLIGEWAVHDLQIEWKTGKRNIELSSKYILDKPGHDEDWDLMSGKIDDIKNDVKTKGYKYPLIPGTKKEILEEQLLIVDADKINYDCDAFTLVVLDVDFLNAYIIGFCAREWLKENKSPTKPISSLSMSYSYKVKGKELIPIEKLKDMDNFELQLKPQKFF